VIGVAIGMIAGYARGLVDEVIMRVVDVFLAFPGLLLNIAIVAVVAQARPADLHRRAVRQRLGRLRPRRPRPGLVAARARLRHRRPRPRRVDAADPGRHIAPNLMAPLLVQMSLGFGA
jgi:ABC-type dipeptide/oligopeptide/nickel transport system permease subunit